MKAGSYIKKISCLITCVLLSIVFSGNAFYNPVLKNADKPFIDLGMSVGNALDADRIKPASTHPPAPEPKEDEKKTIDIFVAEVEIVVSDEKIKIGSAVFSDFDLFESAIDNERMKAKHVRLVDDYAESKTFKMVIRILEKAEIKYELEIR